MFTPGGRVIYVGDTEQKSAYFDPDALRALGVEIEEHGKMPDVVVHHTSKNWLVLIEAVTSHGPVNPKRRLEFEALFANSKAGIVYVTAFLNRRVMIHYVDEIHEGKGAGGWVSGVPHPSHSLQRRAFPGTIQ